MARRTTPHRKIVPLPNPLFYVLSVIFSIGKTHICYWCKGADLKPQSESKFLKSRLKICLNKFKSLDKTVLSSPFQSRLLRLIYDIARCLITTSFMLQRWEYSMGMPCSISQDSSTESAYCAVTPKPCDVECSILKKAEDSQKSSQK